MLYAQKYLKNDCYTSQKTNKKQAKTGKVNPFFRRFILLIFAIFLLFLAKISMPFLSSIVTDFNSIYIQESGEEC